VDGFPGFRVRGAFGPYNFAGLCARNGYQAGGERKKRFSVHGQAVLFPVPKMGKKNLRANRMTHFASSNTQIFV
jgi:hypothetical protein